MSDPRTDIADRLDRAGDRMGNAGRCEEEGSYRSAAAAIRAGLSLRASEELELSFFSHSARVHPRRLSVLSAPGEYDDPGGEGGTGGAGGDNGGGTANGDSNDAPGGAVSQSGAGQLLSTAAPNGLSDPYNPAAGGWLGAAQTPNPYTGGAAGADNPLAPYVGGDADSYTGSQPSQDNVNPFTTGQNVNPYSGLQNTDPFSVSAQGSPAGNSFSAYGFPGYGPSGSILNNPNLLAANDATPANTNIATDAPPPSYTQTSNSGSSNPEISDTGADTGGSVYVGKYTDNGVVYYQFSDISGTVYEVRADNDVTPSAAPSGVTAPGGPGTAPQTATPPSTPNAQQATSQTLPQLPAPDPVTSSETAPTETQPNQPPGDQSGQVTPQQPDQSSPATQPNTLEQNWDAGKAGMWDSLVDMTQGMINISLKAPLGPAAFVVPGVSLDWAKIGAPAPTGDPVRDSELQDNYNAGGWVTKTVAAALPIGAEGIIGSAGTALLPEFEGLGFGIGDDVLGGSAATELDGFVGNSGSETGTGLGTIEEIPGAGDGYGGSTEVPGGSSGSTASRGPALDGDPNQVITDATIYPSVTRTQVSVENAYSYTTETDAQVVAKLAQQLQSRGDSVVIGTGGHGTAASNFINDPSLVETNFLLEDLDLGWDADVQVLDLTDPADLAKFNAAEDLARMGGGNVATIRAWCYGAFHGL